MKKRQSQTGRLLTLVMAISAGAAGVCLAEPASPAGPPDGPKGERSVGDRPRAEMVFARMDRDEDGVISKEEFVAAFNRFQRHGQGRAAGLSRSGKGKPGWHGRPDRRPGRPPEGGRRRAGPPRGRPRGPDGPPWARGPYRVGRDRPCYHARDDRPADDRSRFRDHADRFGARPYAERGRPDRAAGYQYAGPPRTQRGTARVVGHRRPEVQRPSAANVMARFDKNDDGKLTEDEVPEGPWTRMSRADADKDGIVTKKELKRLPMIGPRGRTDKRPAGQLRGRRPAGPAKDRPDRKEKKDRKDKKKAEE